MTTPTKDASRSLLWCGGQGGQQAELKGEAAGVSTELPTSATSTSIKTGLKTQLLVWELILVPWTIMAIVLICFLYAGKSSPWALVAIPIVLGSADAVWVSNRYRLNHTPEVVLGMLIFVGILAATIVGGYANGNALLEYYRITKGASYFNVLPEDLAAGKNDATTLVFASGARIDDAMTYGYVDGYSASRDVYCVAPVSLGDSAAGTRVQYWAAGMNCCEPRSHFNCGKASNDTVTGAIVLPESYRSNPLYAAAVQGAQATYGVQAGDDYLLISWTDDPVRYTEALFSRTRTLFFVFALVYLLISAMLGCILAQVMKPTSGPPRDSPAAPGRLAAPPPPAAPFPAGFM